MRKRLIGILFGILFLFTCNSLVYADTPSEVPIEKSDKSYGHREIKGFEDADAVTEPSYHTYSIRPNQSVVLPSSYRPTDLPTVRNQGQYGTCWAFTAVGLGELSIQRQENKTYDLSERHLAYFTYNTEKDPLGGTDGDKNQVGTYGETYLSLGGNQQYSTNILASWTGLALEDKFPYKDASQKILTPNAYNNDVAHLQNAYFVNMKENRNIAKEMIMKYGGIGISFYIDDSEGNTYYNASHNAYYCNDVNNNNSNHEVIVVGWDDDFKKENFSRTPSGNGAWLIRNSWGENSDCLNGYFWLSYYDSSLSNTGYVYDVVSKGSERYYDHNYLYDGCMGYGCYYIWKTSKTANVFTSQFGNEQLKAVSFGSHYAQERYQISIYKNLTNMKNPESGALVATMSGTTTCAGIYTIPLPVDKTVILNKNDTYSVVVNLNNDAYTGILTEWREDDTEAWAKCIPSVKEGQSFIYESGQWSDFVEKEEKYRVNLRIKAFTNDINETIDAQSITINGDSNKMAVGDKKSLSASILPANVTNKVVVWSSTDNTIASVDQTGTVTAIKNGTVSIIATSGDGKAQTKYDITVYTKVTNIAFTLTDIQLSLGETSSPLQVTYTPSNAYLLKPLTFTSLDNSIAEVKDGRIVAHALGVTTIKATYGDLMAQCTVTVPPQKTVAHATWNQSDRSVTLTWSKIEGVDGYRITRKNGVAKALLDICIGDSVTSYIDENVTERCMYVVEPYVEISGGTLLTSTEVMADYSITYKLNGGLNSSKNPTSYNFNSPQITLTNPTKKGYTFMGWYTNTGYTNRKTTITTSDYGNITLYAKWKANTYTINYILNGGVNSSKNAKTYTISTATLVLANPTRSGYTFAGWYTSSSLISTTKITKIATGSTGTKTLYAKWIKTKYLITYKLNGGTNSKKNPSSYYITTSTFALAKPTRTGYTFGDWYTSSTFKSSSKVSSIVKGSKANKTLYAKWIANTYNVKFDGNKATSGNVKTVTKRKYGTTYKLSANAYTRKGYVFTGWNTKKNGTGKTYKNKASIKNLTSANGKTVTLYAQWKKKK